MSARILVLDIETTRAEVGTFSLFRPFIGIDQVRLPSRILCFAAVWRGEDNVIFKSAWKDGDEAAYLKMMERAFSLFTEADFIVSWNGDKFDLQWMEAEFGRLGLGRPAPYRSIDLFKVAKRNFGQGLLSLKLDWSARQWLGEAKQSHEGLDLWDEIRFGNREQRRYAQKLMKSYNIHDTRLTADLFERYLPWIGENLALYEDNADDGVPRCIQCNSDNLEKRGHAPSKVAMYQRYQCRNCGKWNKGKRMLFSNELRPV